MNPTFRWSVDVIFKTQA